MDFFGCFLDEEEIVGNQDYVFLGEVMIEGVEDGGCQFYDLGCEVQEYEVYDECQ